MSVKLVRPIEFKPLIIILIAFAAVLNACEKYDLDLYRAEESTKIAEYLESLNYTAEETYLAPGIYYMHGKTGIGKAVKDMDSIVVVFKVYTLTKANSTAKPTTTELYSYTEAKPYSYLRAKDILIEGFKTGMLQMREGDTAEFVVPFDYAYGASQNGPIPGLSTLVFKISSVKTFKK